MKSNLKNIGSIIVLILSASQLSYAANQGLFDNPDVRRLIVRNAAIKQINEVDSINNISNLELVCKQWQEVIQSEFAPGKPGWKAWYGVTAANEDIYQMFVNGVLIYRPNPESDEGMIQLKISDLKNPFEGTFNLSQCGDAGMYLSIMTGYKKGKKSENTCTLEIWLAPWFMIEKKLKSTASHFQEIMERWNKETAPVGIFVIWSGWGDLTSYDHLTSDTPHVISKRSLYDNWRATLPSRTRPTSLHTKIYSDDTRETTRKFRASFVSQNKVY